jgi:DNA-binding NarL/FixJ family response regulator
MLAQGAAPSNAGPDFVRAAAAQFGFADSLGIAVSDASGLGCIFGVPLRAATTITRAKRLRWAQLAAHLASGLRLHRTLARLDVAPDAVLDPSGRIDDASPAAGPRAIRDRLRNAVVAMERSRGPLRPDPTQALAGWHVLVDGRWSLVDRFESSGRRYLVALRNDVHLRDPRALTGRERSVAHALAQGRSNKLIAYELGIAEGTVSALVARVSTKLGAKSRADLVQWLATAASATVTHTSLGDGTIELAVARGATSAPQTLTAREAEVARGAVNGGSNESIAAELGIAQRTVANTLARVYRRLGVGSRWELARVFTEGSSQ